MGETHKGICPFCKEDVTPGKAIVENIVRRNIYRCPKCGKSILVCMSPGCSNYSMGGEHYDDNLCPECIKDLPGNILNAGGAIVTISCSLIGAFISVKENKK